MKNKFFRNFEGVEFSFFEKKRGRNLDGAEAM